MTISVKDRSNASEGSIAQHGAAHLTTSDTVDNGNLVPVGDGGYDSYNAQVPSGSMPGLHKAIQEPVIARVQQARSSVYESREATPAAVKSADQDRSVAARPVTAQLGSRVPNNQIERVNQSGAITAYPAAPTGRRGSV